MVVVVVVVQHGFCNTCKCDIGGHLTTTGGGKVTGSVVQVVGMVMSRLN